MFWGLILKPGKKYYKELEQDFHLTHAALDLTDSSGDVQVMLTTENITYLLCTLNKSIPQVVLDQEFAIGDKISFATKGQGVVHLTGNVLPDGMDDLGDEEEGDDEEEMEEEEGVPVMNGKPRSAKQAAKAKVAKKIASGEVSDDSDEDDATFTESMLDDAAVNSENDDDDEEDGEEGEDDDEDDDEEDDDGEEDDDEDDEDDDEDDEDDEEEEADEQPKAKQAKLSNDAKSAGAAQNGNAKQASKEAAPGAKQEQQKKGGAVRTLQDGLMVEDLKVGTGPEAKPGKKIAVYYEGRLKSNNKVFDSTSKGPGLKFALGRGEVIKGWDLGVAGMKVGGKRRLVIPHKLAYGTKGSPPVIPPCSTLVFEVELKKVF